jgi:hypothetical protein
MKLLGICRVELLVADPDGVADAFSPLLGMEFESEVTESVGILSRTDFAAGLELAGPTGPDSVLQPLLDSQGEGLLTIVFRVDSIEGLLDLAKTEGLTVVHDADFADRLPSYKQYRQVSLSSERFPANASFTFAEFEER